MKYTAGKPEETGATGSSEPIDEGWFQFKDDSWLENNVKWDVLLKVHPQYLRLAYRLLFKLEFLSLKWSIKDYRNYINFFDIKATNRPESFKDWV